MIQEALGFGWVKRDDAVVATTRPKETTMTTTLDQRLNALKPGQGKDSPPQKISLQQ